MYMYSFSVDPLKNLQFYIILDAVFFIMVDPCNRLHIFHGLFINKYCWFSILFKEGSKYPVFII